MNRAKLAKLKKELNSARRSPQKARDLEALAQKLGRKLVNRGKHPMWESQDFKLPPLSIPHHGKPDVSIGVRNSILDQLLDDMESWETLLKGNAKEGDEEDDAED